jgi:hypothetical protein
MDKHKQQSSTDSVFKDKASIFDWILQRHVHEYIDIDGRPVGEGRSETYQQVETQFKVCPYSGTRYQHQYPMNVSALHSILPEWQHILLLLSWLGQRYRAFNQTDISTHYDLARVSGTGVFLADYLSLRRVHPLSSKQVPILISGLYKVCLGFQHATFLSMMNEQFMTEKETSLPDAKGFYEWLERHQLLIGEDEVCGGSEVMISRAYEAMRGDIDTPSCPSNIEDVLPELTSFEIDWDAYDVFVAHASNLWREAILFVIQMRNFTITLDEPSLPEALTHKINALLKISFDKLLSEQSGLVVEIAQFTIEDSGRSLEEWLSVQETFFDEMADDVMVQKATNSQLLMAIMVQLAARIELSGYDSIIKTAIGTCIANYETFEATVLHSFNQHLEKMSDALGYENTSNHLTMDESAKNYRKTLHDWPEFIQTVPLEQHFN